MRTQGSYALADGPDGLPVLTVTTPCGQVLTIATFHERTMQGDDGAAEAWANAEHVLAALAAPRPRSAAPAPEIDDDFFDTCSFDISVNTPPPSPPHARKEPRPKKPVKAKTLPRTAPQPEGSFGEMLEAEDRRWNPGRHRK